MRLFRLLWTFLRISMLADLAYRSEFFIRLLYSLLNLATAILSISVLFQQVQHIHGWTFASTLALLGVYLLLSALRGLVFEPSFDALAGLNGEIWKGTFDFTLLRPVPVQFMVSFRRWNIYALFELVYGLGVLGIAVQQLHRVLSWWQVGEFVVTLIISVAVLYAVLLLFSSLIFWSPGFLFTWLFNALFQMARYPTDVYPYWIKFLLTWLIPVGIMTTVPAQALSGTLVPGEIAVVACLVSILIVLASFIFQRGLRHYASASS